MPYYITKEQFDDLTGALNNPDPEARPFADMYDLVYGYLGSPDLFGTDAAGATYAWFGAAAQTNRGEGGGASDFIRDYTQAQIEIRVGYTQDDIGDILQEASDKIAQFVYNDIFNLEETTTEDRLLADGTVLPVGTTLYAIPTAVDIGIRDAVATVEVLDERTDVQNGIGTWSGNPLYIGLGSSMFWNDNVLAGAEDAYEFTVAMEALSDAASTIDGLDGINDLGRLFLEQGWDVLDTLPAATSAGAATATYLSSVYGLIGGITAGVSKLDNNFIPFDPGGFVAGREGDLNDVLSTTVSSDFVHGGDGNDIISGSLGEDLIDGGSGVDVADFSNIDVSYIVTLPESLQTGTADFSGYVTPLLGATGTTTLYNIEFIELGASDDVVIFDFGMNLREIDFGGEGENGDMADFSTVRGQGITASLNGGTATVGLKGSSTETVEVKNVEIFVGSDQGDNFDISGNGVFFGGGAVDRFVVDGTGTPIIIGGSGSDEIVVDLSNENREIGVVTIDIPGLTPENIGELDETIVYDTYGYLDLNTVDVILVNPDGSDRLLIRDDTDEERPLAVKTVEETIDYYDIYSVSYQGYDQTWIVTEPGYVDPEAGEVPGEDYEIHVDGVVGTWTVDEDTPGFDAFPTNDSLGFSGEVFGVNPNGLRVHSELEERFSGSFAPDPSIYLGLSPDRTVIPWVGDLGLGGTGVYTSGAFNDRYYDEIFDISSAHYSEDYENSSDDRRYHYWWTDNLSDSLPYRPEWYLVGGEVDKDGYIVPTGTQTATRDTIRGSAIDEVIEASNQGQTLDGLGGDDDLLGGQATDVLIGGQGNDRLTGGSAGDVFAFSMGDGADTITDFDVEEDTLQIDDVVIDLSNLPDGMILTQTGSDVILSYGSSDTIRFEGLEIADLQPVQIVVGTTGADILVGTNGNDEIFGDNGADDISGLGGDDEIHGGAQYDFIDAGTGDDEVWGDNGRDTVELGDGNDVFHDNGQTGTHAHDTANGGAGNDTFNGGGGDDTFDGGADDDRLSGGIGNDTLTGGTGRDRFVFVAGDGADTITDFSIADDLIEIDGVVLDPAGLPADIMAVESGSDVILTYAGGDTILLAGADISDWQSDDGFGGTPGDDVIVGTEAADVISGAGGNDTITGNGGDDTLNGGDGNDVIRGNGGRDEIDGGVGDDELRGDDLEDTIIGGAGNDRIYGGSHYDVIDAGDGNDEVWGDNGQDTVRLGNGNDIFHDNDQSNQHAHDTVYGGAGADTINGGGGNDIFHGDAGDDDISGGDGDDEIRGGDNEDVLRGGAGNDRIWGGSHYDIIDAGAGNDEVWGDNGQDTVDLGDGDDIFHDNDQSNQHAHDTVDGGAGNDTINGGGGNDTFRGGDGDDVISGGAGNDLIDGGDGTNTLDGGAGDDIFILEYGGGDVIGGTGDDLFRVTGAYSRSEMFTRVIDGGEGIDTLSYADNDNQSGGMWINTGSGSVYGYGGGYPTHDAFSGIEIIEGSQGRDDFSGSAADDTFRGAGGQDWIDAGAGTNVLTGGGQTDTFVFRDDGGDHVITDFDTGQAYWFSIGGEILDDGDMLYLDAPNVSASDWTVTEVGDDVLMEYGDSSVRLLGLAGTGFDADEYVYTQYSHPAFLDGF